MTSKCHAQPHINGNTPDSFKSAGREIHDLAREAREKLRTAFSEPLNSRNYQHMDVLEAAQARNVDLERMNRALDALNDIEAFGIEIYQNGLPRIT